MVLGQCRGVLCGVVWRGNGLRRERLSNQEKDDAPWKGDAWLWVALDPSSKAVISWLTGIHIRRAPDGRADREWRAVNHPAVRFDKPLNNWIAPNTIAPTAQSEMRPAAASEKAVMTMPPMMKMAPTIMSVWPRSAPAKY